MQIIDYACSCKRDFSMIRFAATCEFGADRLRSRLRFPCAAQGAVNQQGLCQRGAGPGRIKRLRQLPLLPPPKLVGHGLTFRQVGLPNVRRPGGGLPDSKIFLPRWMILDLHHGHFRQGAKTGP